MQPVLGGERTFALLIPTFCLYQSPSPSGVKDTENFGGEKRMFSPKQGEEKEQRTFIGKVSFNINNKQKPLLMMSTQYVELTEHISPFNLYPNAKRSGTMVSVL